VERVGIKLRVFKLTDAAAASLFNGRVKYPG
jgi:hypothetical protein